VTSSALQKICGRLLIASVPLVMLVTMAARATNGQAIGSGASVKAPAEAHRLSAGNAVPSAETVHTGDSGAADSRFRDKSKLSVGPKSSVRPDKNVGDPNKSAGAVDIESGSYRFVTGSQGKRSYRVKTPYGSLDVRG
jgi:hypothetical protein